MRTSRSAPRPIAPDSCRWKLARVLAIALVLTLPLLGEPPVAHVTGVVLPGPERPRSRVPPAAGVAATYYVDQNHPQASDDNPGTEEAPWLTIQHAADVVQAGDTVLVKTGFYPERVIPQNSGAAGQRITFRAQPRRTVTMYGFYTVNADYLRIEGFQITTHESLVGWTERYGVFVRSDYVEVVDNYLYDLRAPAIQGYWHEPYPQAAYVAGNQVYRCQQGLGVTGYGWIVEQNEVERLFDHGGGDCDYSRFFGDDHLIRGNYFHGTDFDEIGSAHVDCFQTFDNNGEFGHDVTIEGNLCQDFHQGFMGEAHYYHDISRITFKNNVFVHGGAWGLCVEDISYLTAIHNTFVDIQYHGIGLRGDYANYAVIKNNIFYDTGSSYWFPEGSGSIGDYNLVYASQAPPVSGPHDLVGVDPRFVDLAGDDFHLQSTSPAVDAGEALAEVDVDYDGTPRPQGSGWDIGAFEFLPAVTLAGAPGDQRIQLSWTVNVTLPAGSTWRIDYAGPVGDQVPPVTGIVSPTRAYSLTGLTNHTWYTVTLNAVLGSAPFLTDTVRVMPTANIVYLPLLAKGE